MLVADGEVHVGLAIAGSIERTLHQVLFHGRAGTLGILVEEQHALRQLSVVESLLVEHVGHHGLVVALGHELLDALAIVLEALLVECVVEGEVFYFGEVFLLEIGGGHIIVGTEEREHVLEHAAGSARCGNELHDFAALGLVGIPCVDILPLLVLIGSHDAMADAGCCLEAEERETGFELFELDVDLLWRDAFLSDLL